MKNGLNTISSIIKGSTPIQTIKKGLTTVYESIKSLIVSGTLPITLPNSIGRDLVDYKIEGNSVQGENLYDKMTFTDGYSVIGTGEIKANTNYKASDFLEIIPNATYKSYLRQNVGSIESVSRCCCYDENKNFISLLYESFRNEINSYENYFTTPANAKYIRIGYRKTDTRIALYQVPNPTVTMEVKSVGEKTQNLFSYDEVAVGSNALTNGISIGDDGWVTYYYDNSQGESEIFSNYYTKNSPDLKTNANYKIVLEVKDLIASEEVIFYFCSNSTSSNTSQMVEGKSVRLNNLSPDGIYTYDVTTKSEFDELTTYALRSYFLCPAGAIGSMTFRLSIVEDATVTADTFIYEPYGKYKIPVISRGKNSFNINGDVNTRYNGEKGDRNKVVGNTLTTDIDYSAAHGYGQRIYVGKGNTITYSAKIVSIDNSEYDGTGTIGEIDCYNDNISAGRAKLYFSKNDINKIKSQTFTAATDYVYLCFGTFQERATRTTFSDIQLEINTEATKYEPYIEPITTDIYLTEPLRGINGYSDYIDLSESRVVRKIAKTVLRNTEIIGEFENEPYPYAFVVLGESGKVINDNELCTHFQARSDFSFRVEGNNVFRVLNSESKNETRIVFRLYLNGQIISDVTEVGNYAEEQYNNGTPIIFYYAVADGLETKEMIELPNIPTFKGTTIIDCYSEVIPSNVEIEYIGK